MLNATLDLWRASPLGTLPEEDLRFLTEVATAEVFASGQAMMREGEPDDHLVLILRGRAEVTVASGGDAVPLALVGPGDLLGEMSLLGGGIRSATLTALDDVTAARIDGARIRDAMSRHEGLERALRDSAERTLIARFIREVAAFAALDDHARRRLAEHVRERAYAPGATIIVQGERAEEAFLLRSGRAQVEIDPSPGLPPLKMTPGTLFGEAGLISDAPRAATVRAVEPCTALLIARADFSALLADDRDLASRVVDLARLRARPLRLEAIEEHQRESRDGDVFVVLVDRSRGRYFQLSALGWFVWQRLDGTRNVRDLALEYLNEKGGFAPQPIADLLANLVRAGFVVTSLVQADDVGAPGSALGRFSDRARSALTWYQAIDGVDGALGRLYERYVRFVFTPVGHVVLAVLALAGLVSFVTMPTADRDAGAGMLLLLVPLFALSVLVHEAGHAFATKAVGRRVNRAGFGWFWIGPMAFVDTSDTWLATRGQRLGVALAGPYATIIFGGVLALVARAFDPPVSSTLWVAALASYISVFQNLNPLIELDGYYTLVHLLDRPNLRTKALGWLATMGSDALRHPSHLRGHGFYALYAVASVLYVAVAATLLVLLYRTVVQRWIADVFSDTAAVVIGWGLAIAYVSITVAAIVADVRRARHATRGN